MFATRYQVSQQIIKSFHEISTPSMSVQSLLAPVYFLLAYGSFSMAASTQDRTTTASWHSHANYRRSGSLTGTLDITGCVYSYGVVLVAQLSLLPCELLTPQHPSFLNTVPAIPTSTASHGCHTCHLLATSCQ
jgi:hypothetical protein